MPLFSIRSARDFGIGEIPDLPAFSSWAAQAGFQVLQLLPVNATTSGDNSPYSAASAFALDPLYLGLDEVEDFALVGGIQALGPQEQAELERARTSPQVDWSTVRALKKKATGLAFSRFLREEWRSGSDRARQLAQFRDSEQEWLEDWALYAVLHERFQKHFADWPGPLAARNPEALAQARRDPQIEEAMLGQIWLQWQLDEQWKKARKQSQAVGVELMGDLPFVVSGDSADVWAHAHEFRRDLRVGTPPDDFTAEGQDWGLPVYDWGKMAESDYRWMRKRAARSGALFGLYRVDHVIGLYRTFYRTEEGKTGFTPAHETDQVKLGETMLRIFAEAGEVVAEDLGAVPDFLRPSLQRLGVPGYRVLRWERDGEGGATRYRDPASWPVVSVSTSGSHDLEPHAQWWNDMSPPQRQPLLALPGLSHLSAEQPFDESVRDALLKILYAAPSELVVVPFQDALGSQERINVPGTVADTNWSYRMHGDIAALQRDETTKRRLYELSVVTGRGHKGGAGAAGKN